MGPGAGGGDGESVFHGDKASVWEDENVPEMDDGWLPSNVNVFNST